MLVVSQAISVVAYEINNRRYLAKAPPLYLAMKVIFSKFIWIRIFFFVGIVFVLTIT
jgi:hypothetical protein